MTCTTNCRKPNGNQAHCGACHRTFSAVSTFDRHRAGGADDRHCVSPESVGLRLNNRGVWAGEPRAEAWWSRPQEADEATAAETGSAVVLATLAGIEAAKTLSGGRA